MTADEMFEKLGWEKSFEREGFIGYYTEERELYIDKKLKQFICNNWLAIDELKAINQKCKELGWIE